MTTKHLGKQRLLFLHSDGPTHVHGRDKAIEAKIRRHVMVDIGKARRKPPRTPCNDMILYLPASTQQHSVDSDGNSPNKVDQNESAGTPGDSRVVAPLLTPFWEQHPLAILEQQCGMDKYSAYGITLMIAEGEKSAATSEQIIS